MTIMWVCIFTTRNSVALGSSRTSTGHEIFFFTNEQDIIESLTVCNRIVCSSPRFFHILLTVYNETTLLLLLNITIESGRKSILKRKIKVEK